MQILQCSRKVIVGRDGQTFFLSKKTASPDQSYKGLIGVYHYVKKREATYWKQCLTNTLNSLSKLVMCYLCNTAKFRAILCSHCGHPWVGRGGE